MNILDAVVLGAVEGLTEFLPVSSTGHLILTSTLLGLDQTEFLKSFEIAIQMGAILAVVVFYWRAFLDIETIKKLITAFLPTGIIGLLLYHTIKTYLIGNLSVVVASLFVGGIAIIAFEWWYKRTHILDETSVPDSNVAEIPAPHVSSIPYRTALAIGLFQSIAMIPGVSRSAATIIGGLALGLDRRTIVEFSFLLAVPTMLAATTLDLIKNIGEFSASQTTFLFTGFLAAVVVALGTISFLLRFVKKHDFTVFGIYRIIVAVLFITLVMI
ncbi:MAG: undecaprenyl-diphosphatase UppP [Candidatus Yonathbacteria bacterium]|nr:undecaprenyl-diphosphatase UppP [Candidatus Yonathbacteria bacterium]